MRAIQSYIRPSIIPRSKPGISINAVLAETKGMLRYANPTPSHRIVSLLLIQNEIEECTWHSEAMASHAPLLIFVFITQLPKPRFVAFKFLQLFCQTIKHIFHGCAELVEIL